MAQGTKYIKAEFIDQLSENPIPDPTVIILRQKTHQTKSPNGFTISHYRNVLIQNLTA